MEGWWSELRAATRRLARRPGLTAVAVGTLAIGVGGATAIFSVADAVILRPLPFPQPDRLVLMWLVDRSREQALGEMSYTGYRAWREQSHVFESLAGMASVNL